MRSVVALALTFAFSALTTVNSLNTSWGGESPLDLDIVLTNQEPAYAENKIRQATSEEQKAWKLATSLMLDRIRAGLVDSRISWFDLDLFAQEIGQTQLWINVSDQAIVGSSTRIGSVYFTQSKLVVLNATLLTQLKGDPGSGIVVLHEFLGANGYPDEDYQLSSFFYLAIHAGMSGKSAGLEEVRKAVKAHLDRNARRTTNLQFALLSEGGASSVGGGGDPDTAEIKALALQSLTRAEGISAENLADWLPLFLNLSLEPNTYLKGFSKIIPTSFPGLAVGVVSKKIVIVVDPAYWRQIRSDPFGRSHLVERSQFISNLVNLGFLVLDIKGASSALSRN